MHILRICSRGRKNSLIAHIMELKAFLVIFVKYKKIFWQIIAGSLFCGVVFFLLQKPSFESALTLNVTRNDTQQTTEYTYDDFYRLQADERFADTVVQWIKSSFVINQIQTVHGNLEAKRLSSQVIAVTYVTSTEKSAPIVAEQLITLLNTESQKLNEKQNHKDWFIIIGSAPVVRDHTFSLLFLMGLSCAIGFFIAFWVVLFVHYIKEPR